mmetsp:Transcript_5881/g.8071  ORF Transcript_5881/g.8071 Transcript_5881/m.8071 type:complete len:130 (-) Transcript_5881:222-611(-)
MDISELVTSLHSMQINPSDEPDIGGIHLADGFEVQVQAPALVPPPPPPRAAQQRQYTEDQVASLVQEVMALREENSKLKGALGTLQQQNSQLTQQNAEIAQLKEQLRAAEYKNYALSVHLNQMNKPSLC